MSDPMRMSRKSAWLALVALLAMLIGCAMSAEEGAVDARCQPYHEAGKPCRVPMVRVLVDPAPLLSTDIMTYGLLVSGPSSLSKLYLGRESWGGLDETSSLTLRPADADIEQRLLDLRVSYALVSGTLIAAPDRPEGWNLTLVTTRIIDFIDVEDYADHERLILRDHELN